MKKYPKVEIDKTIKALQKTFSIESLVDWLVDKSGLSGTEADAFVNESMALFSEVYSKVNALAVEYGLPQLYCMMLLASPIINDFSESTLAELEKFEGLKDTTIFDGTGAKLS